VARGLPLETRDLLPDFQRLPADSRQEHSHQVGTPAQSLFACFYTAPAICALTIAAGQIRRATRNESQARLGTSVGSRIPSRPAEVSAYAPACVGLLRLDSLPTSR
jgi:hypothetical protein